MAFDSFRRAHPGRPAGLVHAHDAGARRLTNRARCAGAALALLASTAPSSPASAGNPGNGILFVTQVPIPEEVNTRTVTSSFMSVVSPFGNHLADTAHAGRGGSLMVRYSNGQVLDLLALADWSAVAGARPPANTVAVRNPAVNFAGDKAVFSMVVGAPSGPTDTTTFVWQLYEITLPTQAQLNANVKPVLTRVANQPGYDNVFPCYAPGGRIVFASDRPYNGQAHLLQREEYLGLPTTSGLYSLDPQDASSLRLLVHSPSGAFSPTVDSYGRVVFSNWDHLSRDPQAVTDSRNGVTAAPYLETFTQTFNGSGNFADESAGATFTQVTSMPANGWEIFPEPRNFDHVTLIDVFQSTINGNSQNLFLPWTVNLDGTAGEILNHVGRHEVGATITRSHRNDANIVDLNPSVNPGYGALAPHNFFFNFFAPRENPLVPGAYFGIDGQDVGTHGAGQIVRLDNAGLNPDGTPKNPDGITVTYVTSGATGAKPAAIPIVQGSMYLAPTGFSPLTPANAETLYRTPAPLADGNLVASMAPSVVQTDFNTNTVAQPSTLFSFQLVSLKPSGSTYVPDVALTGGIAMNTSYYVGSTLVSYSGPAWELDPVEIVPRAVPTPTTESVDSVEAGVFASVGVDIPTFQAYLRSRGAALSVSRDVTRRDMHDRQQPFNLRVSWSGHQAVANAGTVYDVGYIQFLQADLRRGYTLGGTVPAPGRRVVATPMHDTTAENPVSVGAPPGAVRLGDDGSFAAIVPAGKALTWHLQANDAAYTSQVKERFWVTFQPGEIRTCANCHGINTSDQTGTVASPVPRPTNPPAALAQLLAFWKAAHPSGTVQLAAPTYATPNDAGTVDVTVTRVGGSTGPASVSYGTVAGTATAGVDFTAVSGSLTWADGDTAPKTVTVSLLGAAIAGSPRTFQLVLSSPTFAALGGTSSSAITVYAAGTPYDAGTADAAVPTDAGVPVDAGADSGSPATDAGLRVDASNVAGTSSGCGCEVAGRSRSAPTPTFAGAGLVLAVLAASRRRRG